MKAWMTVDIFERWLRMLDHTYLLQGRTTLVIDNYHAHLKITDLKAVHHEFTKHNQIHKAM